MNSVPVKTFFETPLKSRPYIDDYTRQVVNELLVAGELSQFIGSPGSRTLEQLSWSSQEMATLPHGSSFFGGKRLRELEVEWSRLHNAKFSVGVNSATSGLLVSLLACGIGRGDRVAVPSYTFTATAAAVLQAGAVPVFVDIDPETMCMAPCSLSARENDDIKAVIYVSWNGNLGDIVDVSAICRRNNWVLIEDASQAPAASLGGRFSGSWGAIGVFSLNQPKNVSCGEGGIVTTNCPDLAARSRLIRNHGENVLTSNIPFHSVCAGYNFRLPEILAAIALGQVKKIHHLQEIRARNYAALIEGMSRLYARALRPIAKITSDKYVPYHAGFVWVHPKVGRNAFVRGMLDRGVPLSLGISSLLSDQPIHRVNFGTSADFPPSSDPDTMRDITPRAREMFEKRYIGFPFLGWPTVEEDITKVLIILGEVLQDLETSPPIGLVEPVEIGVWR